MKIIFANVCKYMFDEVGPLDKAVLFIYGQKTVRIMMANNQRK